jgi:hypothetical protein
MVDCWYGWKMKNQGGSREAGGVDFESERFGKIPERHAGLVRQDHDWDSLTVFFTQNVHRRGSR